MSELEEDVQDQLIDVRCIQSSNGAFAAVTHGGSVVTWGNANNGSISDKVQVGSLIEMAKQKLENIFCRIYYY